MELVDGRTLADRLAAEGALPIDEATRIIDAVLAALAAAHARGLVHRDVKPANVLLGADGSVKLADFGIAKVVSDEAAGLTVPGQVLGTPRYVAPEQTRGADVGPATDVYGAGIVLYEMLAGAAPFRGESPAATALAHADEPVPPLRSAVRRSPSRSPPSSTARWRSPPTGGLRMPTRCGTRSVMQRPDPRRR